ncbi:MAG: TetR/AcrR family transcriptional regulator [Sphingomonas sp.]
MEANEIKTVGTAAGRVPGGSRKAQAARREETSTAILDAAEHLFAHHGRDGVTIKAIAKAAGVDTALVHYYFADKDGVLRAVWSRRTAVLNPVREAAMDAYEARAGERLDVREVLDVFLRPIFETAFNNGEGWANFAAIAGATNASRFGGADLMDEFFDPIVLRFIGLLRRASPETPDRDLYWFMHLLSGALTQSLAQTGRIDTLSGGICRSSDMASVLETMIALFSQGFEAIRGGLPKSG